MHLFAHFHNFVFFGAFHKQAAIAMVPEGQLAAESALAVGAGGLDLGWFGHALWMLGYAAVFLYVAVMKWLSVRLLESRRARTTWTISFLLKSMNLLFVRASSSFFF